MRKFLLLIGVALAIQTQAQNFQWVKKLGGSGGDFGFSIAVDASKNVYTTGWFQGTADFDPGTGTSNLTSAGSDDIFISKLDASGNFVWAKRIGGTSSDIGYGITTDNTGNVYLTGSFAGTVDFDPGANTNNLTSAGLDDIFVLKLDASGNFLWAKRIGGSSNDLSYAISLDGSGNIFIGGQFRGTADFDPGANTFNLTSNGQDDIFIGKLDASGNFLWAKNIGGTSYDYGRYIDVDANGNVYSTGEFSGTVDFNPGTGIDNLVSNGESNIYVNKLDPSGNFVWAKNFGGSADNTGNSIVADADGNTYTTGYFTGTVDFDPGANENKLTSNGGTDIFIVKLDTDGNLSWANNIGGSGDDEGYSVTLDALNNVYTTGYFQGTASFETEDDIFEIKSSGISDIFVSKFDASGNFIWLKGTGSSGVDSGNSITVDNSDNIYLTGTFQGTVDFDLNTGSNTLTSSGGYDIFIVKYNQTITSIGNTISESVFNLYPNPATEKIIIKSSESIWGKEFYITDITGKKVLKGVIRQETTEIKIENIPSGIYFLTFNDTASKSFHKIIKK